MTEDSSGVLAASHLVEDVQDTIARNLSAARNGLGLSQDQLAAAAGLSRATVNQLEGGSTAKGDPRLSTVVCVAAGLGIAPAFLLLGPGELDALMEAFERKEEENISSHLTAEKLETMRRLLRSGMGKNRMKAVEMGATAAASAGLSAGAIAAAAIGTGLLPGIGTVIGAALGSIWLTKRIMDEKKNDKH